MAAKRSSTAEHPVLRVPGRLLAEGRLPECWIPPAQILEYRALLETYHDLRRAHTAWVQRIHAVFFHQGAPALSEGALRTEEGLAALRAAAAAHLSPAAPDDVFTVRTYGDTPQPYGRPASVTVFGVFQRPPGPRCGVAPWARPPTARSCPA
jgi:hypothetical protein